MLPTDKIHNGTQNYDVFCKYAGITFEMESSTPYTGITGLTHYDNPIVNGCVRWDDTYYGYLATVHSVGTDNLHQAIMQNTLNIPREYGTPTCVRGEYVITRHGFERWLNDQLLTLG